jgi:hypothetical protein
MSLLLKLPNQFVRRGEKRILLNSAADDCQRVAAQYIYDLGCSKPRQIVGANYRGAVFRHDVVETSTLLGEMFDAGFFFQYPSHVGDPAGVHVPFLFRISQSLFHQGDHRVLIKPTGAEVSVLPTTNLELPSHFGRRVYAGSPESIHVFLSPPLINDVDALVALLEAFFDERK